MRIIIVAIIVALASSITAEPSLCPLQSPADLLVSSFLQLAGPGFEKDPLEGVHVALRADVSGLPLKLSVRDKNGDRKTMDAGKVLKNLLGKCCPPPPAPASSVCPPAPAPLAPVCPPAPPCHPAATPATISPATPPTTTEPSSATAPETSNDCPPSGVSGASKWEYISYALGSGGFLIVSGLLAGLYKIVVQKKKATVAMRELQRDLRRAADAVRVGVDHWASTAELSPVPPPTPNPRGPRRDHPPAAALEMVVIQP
jgi:hypothetical protein